MGKYAETELFIRRADLREEYFADGSAEVLISRPVRCSSVVCPTSTV